LKTHNGSRSEILKNISEGPICDPKPRPRNGSWFFEEVSVKKVIGQAKESFRICKNDYGGAEPN
jgi:hypothetical protein